MANQITVKNKIKDFNKNISVSGDKSLSIRWVLFSSIAKGKSKAYNLLLSEDVLAAINAVKKLGAQDVKEAVRSVSFRGDKGFMYKANIALRTAVRILKPIKVCKVYDEEDLYEAIQKIKWENFLDAEGTFAIGAVVNSKNFTSNSHYIALKSKDAVADYFRHKYHKRPNVDLKYPDVKIHIHIQKEWLTVSLDSSGDSLHKRGYRTATNIAPINEVLAAGMVLLSGYTGDENFIDPMCGSGTILIEAAMIANNIPANINRKLFAFENWKDYDEDLFSSFGLTIVDECHHIGAEVFVRSLFKIVTKYVLGLSATMNRKDGLTRVFKMFLGEVLYKEKKGGV